MTSLPQTDFETALRDVGQTLDGSDPGRWQFLSGKVRRHLHWARTAGLRALVEEDRLNPVERTRVAYARRHWQRAEGCAPGTGRVAFVVGLQRSGTNMLLRGLERSSAVAIRNENDRAAFSRYRLDDEAVGRLAASSRAGCLVFKPLCDAHRTPELLAMSALAGGRAVAVWVYRSVDDRVRSSLAKFGDHDRTVVNAIASGAGEGLWQAGGLSAGVRATMADLAGSGLSAESASALFWWARNTMAFDLGLAGRSDVRFQSYDALLRGPEEQMRRLADFLGIAYRPAMVGHIEPRRSAPGRQLPLDSRVRGLCDALQARLDAVGLSAGLSGSAR